MRQTTDNRQQTTDNRQQTTDNRQRLFSFVYYGEIIDAIKKSGKSHAFYQINKNTDKFVIMRHDVEFSVERAYNLAVFENTKGFHSTYFFQLTNDSYNILSRKNRELILEIIHMGHNVGLHFHLNDMTDIGKIKSQIKKEIEIMGSMLDKGIDSFSIHRPTADVLRNTIKLEGIINAYDNLFFSFTEDVMANPPKIKYISDARHHWNYGLEPSAETIKKYDKIQILVHPYSWTENGYDNVDNFKTLIIEKNQALIATIDSECKHFAEVRDAL
jgi:hypothetical protein